MSYHDIIESLENSQSKIELWLEHPEIWYEEIIAPHVPLKKLTPWQTAFIKWFENIDNNYAHVILSAGRGCSKTMTVNLYNARRIFFDPSLRIGVLAGSEKQATEGYNYMMNFFKGPKMEGLISGKINQKQTKFIGGGHVSIAAASEEATRSQRLDIEIVDECILVPPSLINGFEGCLQGSRPSALKNPDLDVKQRVLSSTPNSTDHVMYDWWVQNGPGVEEEDRTFHTFRIPARKEKDYNTHVNGVYFECPWILDKRIDLLQRQVKMGVKSREFVDIELRGLFRNLNNPTFSREHIDLAFSSYNPNQIFDKFFIGFDWGEVHDNVALIAGVNRGGFCILKSFHWKGLDTFIAQIEEIFAWIFDYLAKNNYSLEDTEIIAISEDSGISKNQNKFMKSRFQKENVKIKKKSFIKHKNEHITMLKFLFALQFIQINPEIPKLRSQLHKYHYEESPNEKQPKPRLYQPKDDFVDALMFATWKSEHFMKKQMRVQYKALKKTNTG